MNPLQKPQVFSAHYVDFSFYELHDSSGYCAITKLLQIIFTGYKLHIKRNVREFARTS